MGAWATALGTQEGGMILEAGQKLGVVVSSKCASPRAPHSPAIKRGFSGGWTHPRPAALGTHMAGKVIQQVF